MKRLLIFFVLFFLGLCLTAFGTSILDKLFDPGSREFILWTSVIQSLLAFCLPAWIISGMYPGVSYSFENAQACQLTSPGASFNNGCAGKLSFLRLNISPTIKNILGVLCLYCIAIPALNQIIYWNQNISLPEAFYSFEAFLRNMEETAATTTTKLLSDSSLCGMLSGVLVVGIVTGFSEELFFRAGLQQVIRKCGVSVDIAVWTSAFIFSALHFQFFGFVPRLLMGVMFGYLFVWSGSLWTSAFAHALNNSMVVVTTWFSANGYFKGEVLENLGVSETGFPLIAIISAASLFIFLFFFRKSLFITKNSLRNG